MRSYIRKLPDLELSFRGRGGGGISVNGAEVIQGIVLDPNGITKNSLVYIRSNWITPPARKAVIATSPSSNITSFAFDSSMTYLVFGNRAGEMAIFKKQSNGSYSFLRAFSVGNVIRGVTVNPAGNIFAAAYENTSPYLSIYHRKNDSSFTQLTLPSAKKPTRTTNSLSFDSTSTYMLITALEDGAYMYKFTYSSSGASVSFVTAFSGTGYSRCGVFDKTGKYLAIGGDFTNQLLVCSWINEVAIPLPVDVYPPNDVLAVAFDPTGTYLAAGFENTPPYLYLYKISDGKVMKVAEPAVPLPGTVRSLSFDSSGKLLAVGHEGSPYLTVYKVSGEFLERFDNPQPIPSSSVYGVVFDPSSSHLFLAENAGSITDYQVTEWGDHTIYGINDNSVETLYNLIVGGTTGFGVALSNGAYGEEKKVLRIWNRITYSP